MDSFVIEEATLLTKPYSILRISGQKWKSSTKDQHSSTLITLHKDHSSTQVQISKPHGLDIYKPIHLYKRNILRKNPALLKIFQCIWETINPYKFFGISKKVYFYFFVLAYKQTKRDVLDLLDQNIQIDLNADFGHKSWLGFSEFYDSVFEFLDTYTKSFASIEYIFLLKGIFSALQDSKWCSSISLYSKIHLPLDAKPLYHYWMVPLLKNSKFSKDEVPNMIKIPSDVHVSERLLRKKTLKPVDRENFNFRKLEQMMNAHLLKGFKQGVPLSVTHNTFRPKDKKANTLQYNHSDKISPLSVVLKQSRSKKNVLEKVIDGRKSVNFLKLV